MSISKGGHAILEPGTERLVAANKRTVLTAARREFGLEGEASSAASHSSIRSAVVS